MAQVIYKYVLRETDVQEVAMPAGAQILSVGLQYGHPVMWAKVVLGMPNTERRIRIIGTGNSTGITAPLGPFIGTIQMDSGLVWHVFDQGEAPT